MTSNGPVSWRRSLNSRVRVIVAAAISSSPCRTWTVRKPSLRRPRRDRRSSACWRRITWSPKSRSGRLAFRSRQTLSGTSSTIATGSTSCSRASATSERRASTLHVGRVHDGQPPGRQPLADDEVEQLERVRGGGLVVLVVGDQAAAEVGRDHLGRLEVLARERRLARAADADEDDEAQLGHPKLGHAVTLELVEDRHLGRRADLGVVPAHGQEPHAVAVALRHRLGPVAELPAGPLEAVVAVPRRARRQRLVADVVLDVRRGDDDRGRGRARRRRRARAPPAGAGRRAR